MENKTMYRLSYGLYALSAQEKGFDNACIVNTAIQITTTPNRICVTVNKQNKTHDMIMATKKFNLSILNQEVSFDTIKNFGFQSGNNVDKFISFVNKKRSENGLYYLTEGTNGFISGNVFNQIDLGTHTMFFADVEDAEILNNKESLTYAYYQSNIKPKPQEKKTGKTKYRCRICGYEYEGEELPADFICPICKHGAEDFEKIEG